MSLVHSHNSRILSQACTGKDNQFLSFMFPVTRDRNSTSKQLFMDVNPGQIDQMTASPVSLVVQGALTFLYGRYNDFFFNSTATNLEPHTITQLQRNLNRYNQLYLKYKNIHSVRMIGNPFFFTMKLDSTSYLINCIIIHFMNIVTIQMAQEMLCWVLSGNICTQIGQSP